MKRKTKFPEPWHKLGSKHLARFVKCHLWGPTDLLVLSPYCPAFSTLAKELGGRFVGHMKCWRFDPERESAVRFALFEIYGTDGSSDPSLERVLLRADRACTPGESELWALNQRVAWRDAQKGDLWLAANVRSLTGGFAAPSRSRELSPVVPTLLEVSFVPGLLAWKHARQYVEHLFVCPVGTKPPPDFDPHALSRIRAVQVATGQVSAAPTLQAFPPESIARELPRLSTAEITRELRARIERSREIEEQET